jgi:hypothetical protein
MFSADLIWRVQDLHCCCGKSAHRESVEWCSCAGVLFMIDHSLEFCRLHAREMRYSARVARRA